MSKKTFGPATTNSGLKWFEYSQNNSGGSFHKDDDVSITVLVQATSSAKADRDAVEKAGVYFNGCASGADCSCCGDRWHEAWDDAGMESFKTHHWVTGVGYETNTYNTIEEWAEAQAKIESWSKTGESAVILYYADGTKTVYYKE